MFCESRWMARSAGLECHSLVGSSVVAFDLGLTRCHLHRPLPPAELHQEDHSVYVDNMKQLGLEWYWHWVNWMLGTGQYFQILGSIIIGWYFFHYDTQYDTNQTAVSTVLHMISILTSVVRPSPADDSREWGGRKVQAIHRHHTVLRFYMVQCFIYFASKSIHCYATQ